MNEIYELVHRGDEWNWNPIEGDKLPDWAQNREPDYPNLEVVPSDRPAGFNRFANRVTEGYQAILRISGDRADLWVHVSPI